MKMTIKIPHLPFEIAMILQNSKRNKIGHNSEELAGARAQIHLQIIAYYVSIIWWPNNYFDTHEHQQQNKIVNPLVTNERTNGRFLT